ncbi:hypothetical protein [Chitinophaga nivalis]|uniref:Bacteriocin n=1 Tax=Chitinophaga nivalis TaxID=2991709 RepID=A0ABT3IJB7_9BACT|nr:hypothetical protein [Chitinophaga nivalis]MCW3466271.1 hypothetical protein [Chitinophaga nivalis]MCW3484038.1 hypothetical protein [Chitinophaga nivalis]
MKKKQPKKLNLGKIQIADLNNADKLVVKGGKLHGTVIQHPTTEITESTGCFVCDPY